MKKYIIIILFFYTIFILTPNASADSGPKNDFFIVLIDIAAIGYLTYGCFSIFKYLLKYKDKKKLPVTSILFNQEDVNIIIEIDLIKVKATFEYINLTSKLVYK